MLCKHAHRIHINIMKDTLPGLHNFLSSLKDFFIYQRVVIFAFFFPELICNFNSFVVDNISVGHKVNSCLDLLCFFINPESLHP